MLRSASSSLHRIRIARPANVISRHTPSLLLPRQTYISTSSSLSQKRTLCSNHCFQQSSRLSWITPWLLASLIFISTTLLSTPASAEAEQSKKPAFTKEQVGVICIIGGPKSGKSTQLQNIVKRFDIKELKYSDNIQKEIEDIVSSAPKGQKPRVIIENFPSTVEQSNKFESEICPILVIVSIVFEEPEKAISRLTEKIDKNDAKINWKRYEDKSTKLIEKFRFQGNILEITGKWPADEVWEQVEAKLESALELDDRGEL